MLIIDGTIGSELDLFLEQLQQDNLDWKIIPYQNWIHQEQCNSLHPKGIILLRVAPEIALQRIKQNNAFLEQSLTLEDIQKAYKEKEDLYRDPSNFCSHLGALPLLVLNGNIDFKKDFGHYYNHVFYIKKFIKELQDKEAMMNGTYQKKIHHRHCC